MQNTSDATVDALLSFERTWIMNYESFETKKIVTKNN